MRTETRSQCEEVIVWCPSELMLPDDELSVLGDCTDGEVRLVYRDGELWRDSVTGDVCVVMHWADLPIGPH